MGSEYRQTLYITGPNVKTLTKMLLVLWGESRYRELVQELMNDKYGL